MSENQNTFIFIKDLGSRPVGKQGRKIKFGLFECPICKNHFEVSKASVKSGLSTKCLSCARTKHGLKNHKLYKVWGSMINRVNNKLEKRYMDYGGRGITVCSEWRNDFKSFYDWCMDNGYKKGLSIDRIDNDGNYEPSNCRWTTKSIQSQNTRLLSTRNTSGYRGVNYRKDIKKFRAQIMVMNKSIVLGYFKTSLEAAKAYDNYVIENNLEHTINNV